MLAPLIAAALQAAAAPPPADTDDKAVLATAQAFFDGFEKSDVAAMRATLLPNAQLMSLTSRPGGELVLRRFGFEETFGTKPPVGAKEWMWSPVIIRRGALATVSAPYELTVNGKTIHCGMDVFTLAKTDGAWKIASISWTAEPEACPELRKM
jgi:hypothetical protein